MVTEDEPAFRMDIEYAKQIIDEWESKGYKTFILRSCIGIRYYSQNDGFGFMTHSGSQYGTALYELKSVNGKECLVFLSHRYWDSYHRKLVWLAKTDDPAEYECLFEKDAVITEGDEKNKSTICSGIDAIMDYLHQYGVEIAYKEFQKTGTYSCTLVSSKDEIIITVNDKNLIKSINLLPRPESLIIDTDVKPIHHLKSRIPRLIAIRALDPVQMHAYAIQMTYEDHTVRNYYLTCFTEREVPETVIIDGRRFSREVLDSVSQDCDGNAIFSNGYMIPKHVLFYLSCRQLQVEITNRVLCAAGDGLSIRSRYRLPLKEFRSHFQVRYYWGSDEECFGPGEAWLDEDGNRTSDITVYSSRKSECNIGAPRVVVEPSWKIGFLFEDGTWLAPPVYDSAETFSLEGCTKVTRTENGEQKTYLLTEKGKEIPFPYDIDIDSFWNDRCPFNAEPRRGHRHDGYYYDCDHVYSGKWGFVDSEGRIIVEPKYEFVVGFYNGGDDHSVVARRVDGKLLWGVIDLAGNEVIPCQYPELYSRCGEAVAFRTEEYGQLGLMDFDGNVIVEPQFDYIEEYDPERRLITAGDSEDDLGVFSVDLGKMIIPKVFDCISYSDHMITCEEQYKCTDRFFDYTGKELFFPGYECVSEYGGLLHYRKDGKTGVHDWEGHEIIPPVLNSGLQSEIELYQKGYVIKSSAPGLKGLSRITGEELIPEIYSEISVHGDLVVCSKRTDTNWCICDSLFTLNGEKVLEGAYRRIYIDDGTKTLTVETPLGEEFCSIDER